MDDVERLKKDNFQTRFPPKIQYQIEILEGISEDYFL